MQQKMLLRHERITAKKKSLNYAFACRGTRLVAGTGCGCPADTSVQSAEAPTEAAAETLNLRPPGYHFVPLAVPKVHNGLERL